MTHSLKQALRGLKLALLGSLLMTGCVVYAAAPVHPGEAVFAAHCAACHGESADRSANQGRSLATLRSMIPSMIEHALTDGPMRAQGAALSETQRRDLVGYLAGSIRGTDAWETAIRCPAERARVDIDAPIHVGTFGINHHNHRYLSAAQAGLTNDDLSRLELAWVLAFPNITMMRAQPAVLGNTLFVSPVESQKIHAFNIDGEPCLQWTYTTDRNLRTSLTVGRLSDGRAILLQGDREGAVHAVNAATGEGMWVTSLKRYPETIITGTPQLSDDRVYASVSQFEIMIGAQPDHECCKASGAVAALDARTGKVVWETPMLPKAKPVRDRGDGQQIWGPSGAPVWTSPAMDKKRGLLYVGTGEANSEPAHSHTDAIVALRLDDGAVAWSFQASANDIFLVGCGRERSLNCPPEYSIERDVDFGASVIIAQNSDGEDLLLAGQKSSVVWALDPDDKGRVLWRWSYGTGTANGGIHWAMVYDGHSVYAPLNDPGRPRPGFQPVPGLYALDATTGSLRWGYHAKPDCDGRRELAPRCEFLYGLSAAPIGIDRAVVTGSLDGHLRIFDADTGAIIYHFDTLRAFDSVTGIPGQGGAIDSAALVAANGLLLVNSGYGMFGQPQGNVLLAFRPAKPVE